MQRHLQLRIEAQGKYMQSILEKACQTLAGESNNPSGSYKGNMPQGVSDVGPMKDFCPSLNFPPFQDLNIYGENHHQLDLQHNIERPSIDGFLSNNDTLCLGKKRPNPYGGSGKSPLIWSDDLRLQDLGSTIPQDDQIQIAPPSTDLDSISDIYEAKPVLSGSDHGIGDKGSNKLERPSPRRSPLSSTERMNPIMSGGRNSPYG